MTRTPLTEDHLPHPPIPLIELVSTNDHKVPWADMEEWSFRLHREIAVINRHTPPMNSTPVLIAIAAQAWQPVDRAGVLVRVCCQTLT